MVAVFGEEGAGSEKSGPALGTVVVGSEKSGPASGTGMFGFEKSGPVFGPGIAESGVHWGPPPEEDGGQ